MDIHKPKPWHGFREFLKEYLIIVVGVLTALGAEQLVETLHWGHRVEQTRRQLDEELRRDGVSAWGWLSSSKCQDRQLDGLERVLLDARHTGRIDKVAAYYPDLWVWTDDAWANARSLQVADHVSADEMRQYSLAYFFPHEMKENIVAINQLAAELTPLREGLDRVTAEEAGGFLKTLGRIRELKSRQDLAATLLLQSSAKLGLRLTERERQRAQANALADYGDRACLVDPATIMRTLGPG